MGCRYFESPLDSIISPLLVMSSPSTAGVFSMTLSPVSGPSTKAAVDMASAVVASFPIIVALARPTGLLPVLGSMI